MLRINKMTAILFFVIHLFSFGQQIAKKYISRDDYIRENLIKKNNSVLEQLELHKNEEKIIIKIIDLQYIDQEEITSQLSSVTNIEIKGIDNKIILIGNEKNKDNLDIINNLIKDMDKPKKQVVIQGRIIDTSTNLFERLGVNWLLTDRSDDEMKRGLVGKFLMGEISISKIFSSGGKFLGIDFNMLRENGEIKIESMPILVVMEDKEGILKVTEEVLVGEKAIVKNNTEYFEPIFSEAGIMFKINPTIKEFDNEYKIFLDIETEISNFKLTSSYNESKGAKQKNQTKTVIKLVNGSSTFIGGLNQNVEKETLKKVPILSEIPIIGPLFRYKAENKEIRDIFIEIEAYVID